MVVSELTPPQPTPPQSKRDLQSAGAVVFGPGGRVLLVHRPKYDDWSFPKGKLDRGEHATAAAVREVAEETGVAIRLGLPLANQRYPISKGMKAVTYWIGRVVGDHDVSGYVANSEIDAVAWVDRKEALGWLTYDYDRDTLVEAGTQRRRTTALIVLRHGAARSRKVWRQDDRLRPLLVSGRLSAERMRPVLAAYDVQRVVSSSSIRCLETVTPFADLVGRKVRAEDELSEEGTTATGVRRIVEDLVGRSRGSVLCTHRPVLPAVFDALGLEDPDLEAGEMFVTHLRGGRVLGSERHLVR